MEQPAGLWSGHSAGAKLNAPGVFKQRATNGGTTLTSGTTAAFVGKDMSSLTTAIGAPPAVPPVT
jgi:hypothetical protein